MLGNLTFDEASRYDSRAYAEALLRHRARKEGFAGHALDYAAEKQSRAFKALVAIVRAIHKEKSK
jgi:hypothetical protein